MTRAVSCCDITVEKSESVSSRTSSSAALHKYITPKSKANFSDPNIFNKNRLPFITVRNLRPANEAGKELKKRQDRKNTRMINAKDDTCRQSVGLFLLVED